MSDKMLPGIDQDWPELGQLRTEADQSWSEIGHIRPALAWE